MGESIKGNNIRRGCLIPLLVFGVLAAPSFSAERKSFILTPDLTIGRDSGDDNLIFASVERVRLDAEQNIYVADWSSQTRIQVFDPKGGFLRSIPLRPGQGPAEVSDLMGVAVGPSGTIYVLDRGGNKVMLLDRTGKLLSLFKIDFRADDIGLLPGEQIVLLGVGRGKIIHAFDKDGKPLASFGDPFEIPVSLSQYKDVPVLTCPLRFNTGADGTIYVFNPHRFEVLAFRDGKLRWKVEGRSRLFRPARVRRTNIEGAVGFGFPLLTALGSGDRLYVTVMRSPKKEGAANEMIIFEKGERVGSLEVAGLPTAIDSQGRLYCGEETDYPRLVRYVVKEK
jgi:hypothetical protein